MRPHVHVFVTVCTDDNRLVTKCACGEQSPSARPAPAVEFKPKRKRAVRPPAPAVESERHEPLRAGRCNAADRLSALRCTFRPGHRARAHSWVTA